MQEKKKLFSIARKPFCKLCKDSIKGSYFLQCILYVYSCNRPYAGLDPIKCIDFTCFIFFISITAASDLENPIKFFFLNPKKNLDYWFLNLQKILWYFKLFSPVDLAKWYITLVNIFWIIQKCFEPLLSPFLFRLNFHWAWETNGRGPKNPVFFYPGCSSGGVNFDFLDSNCLTILYNYWYFSNFILNSSPPPLS